MILVTVGTQLPFDRLVQAVDEWAYASQNFDIIFQSGHSNYQPQVGVKYDFVPSSEMERFIEEANLVVSHAGTGTIFNCLSIGKPLVILPRLFKFNEHRNDHQLKTFLAFRELPGIYAASEEAEIAGCIEQALSEKTSKKTIGRFADDDLLEFLRDEINFL